MRIYITLIIAFIYCATAQMDDDYYDDEDRINGGSPVRKGEFPFIVSIAVNGSHFCGGFIYNERYVVTTASCVQGISESLLNILAGEVLLDSGNANTELLKVRTVIIHNSYNSQTKLNDIALIEVLKGFTFGPNINFAFYDEVNTTSPMATIAGWGNVGEDVTVGPLSELKKANISLTADCSSYSVNDYSKAQMICAGDKAIDTGSPCTFDIGSPLFQNGIVVGIASKYLNCGMDASYPSIYTRLSYYYAWLQSNAGQQPNYSNFNSIKEEKTKEN